MPTDDVLRRQRRETCMTHMTEENAHAFDRCIAAFRHPRYELVPTSEVFDGHDRVHALMLENRRGDVQGNAPRCVARPAANRKDRGLADGHPLQLRG
jgi:hypothetical protein